MRLIIGGNRLVEDIRIVEDAIRSSGYERQITEVVNDGLNGASKLAEMWSIKHNILVKKFYADWQYYSRFVELKSQKNPAGEVRNRNMANYADAAIIIWDGKDEDVKNLIDSVKIASKPLFLYRINKFKLDDDED